MFNASMETIASELLQNSRRAGASKVDVTIERLGPRTALVSFLDDGKGLEDIGDLVAFGRSTWNDHVKSKEDTAGMGSFCLASRGCTVQSRGRKARLTPAAFVGAETVRTIKGSVVTGTMISFELQAPRDVGGEDTTFRAALRAESRFAPIKVALNGTSLEQKRFLDGCIGETTVDGIAIGFVRHKPKTHEDWQKPASRMNFFGHVVETPRGIFISDGDGGWTALWDVQDNARLRMTLPTRDKVLQNREWTKLLEATLLAGMRLLASQDSHRGDMRQIAWARQHGITIADPLLMLRPWSPVQVDPLEPWWSPARERRADILPELGGWPSSEQEGTGVMRRIQDRRGVVPAHQPPPGCVLVPRLTAHQRHALVSAARRLPQAPPLAYMDHGYDSLQAYDDMPRISGIIIGMTHPDGTRSETDDFEAFQQESVLDPAEEDERPSYDVTIQVTERQRTWTWPTVGVPALLTSPEGEWDEKTDLYDGDVIKDAVDVWGSRELALDAVSAAVKEIAAATFSPWRTRQHRPHGGRSGWIRMLTQALTPTAAGGPDAARRLVAEAMISAARKTGVTRPGHPLTQIEIGFHTSGRAFARATGDDGRVVVVTSATADEDETIHD